MVEVRKVSHGALLQVLIDDRRIAKLIQVEQKVRGKKIVYLLAARDLRVVAGIERSIRRLRQEPILSKGIERLKKAIPVDLHLVEVYGAIQFAGLVSGVRNRNRAVPSEFALDA